MVIVTVLLTGKPERRMQILLLANAMVPASRAEDGCISYDFYEKQPGRNEFLFLQVWRDRAAYAAHMRTPHFLEMMKYLPECRDYPSKVRVFDISECREVSLAMFPSSCLTT
jgi:quinol monooxygenase YgiN